jgi:hypothetical protein
MIAPTFVGYGSKSFTDCTTYSPSLPFDNWPNSYSITLSPNPDCVIRQGDVAIATATDGTYPTSAGWTKIVTGSKMSLWMKTLSSSSDTSSWSNPSGGYSLFYSGVAITVFRSPYGSNALYYANNENLYTAAVGGGGTGPHSVPALSRTSFEDSDFYYRVDVTHITEDWGSYYNPGFNFVGGTFLQWGGGTSSSNCANTGTFLYSPGEAIYMSGQTSSNLSGLSGQAYTQGTSPTNNFYVRTITFWIRGFTQSQSGVMV